MSEEMDRLAKAEEMLREAMQCCCMEAEAYGIGCDQCLEIAAFLKDETSEYRPRN